MNLLHTRRSQARASSAPPPRAKPSTAAIVGIGSAAKALNVALKSCTNSDASCCDMTARSFKSAPAEKTPAAVERTTTQRVDDS